MKYLLLLLLSFIAFDLKAQNNNTGQPLHIVGGMVVGGVTSYFVYKKTDNKVKSWAIGTGASILAGIAKEAIDSAGGKDFSGEDLAYTALGGVIGASIVFPLKKKKPKEVAYLF